MSITRTILAAAGVLTPAVTREVVLIHAADEVPIYSALMSQGLEQVTPNERFEWASASMEARRTQIDNGGAAYDGTTTVLTVDSSAPFYVDAVVRAEATGEIMIVTVINSATQITVVRGVGSAEGGVAGAAGSVANNAWLMVVGNARKEGSGLSTARGIAPSLDYNWCQIFRRTLKLTGTAASSSTLTEDERNRQRAKELEEITRDMELAFIGGQRSQTTIGAERHTTTGGFTRYIQTNVDNVAGAMSKTRLNAAMAMAWAGGGPSIKWGFGGLTFCDAVDTIFDGKLRVSSPETAPGIIVRAVPTRYGQLNLITHRLMVGDLAGSCLVIDPSVVQLRFMADRQLQLRQDVQNKGDDAVIDEWMAHVGLEVGPEKRHGIIKGVTGAA